MDCNLNESILLSNLVTRKVKTKITWACKIGKFSSWMGVGICLKKPIVNGNYQFTYSMIGHGSYLLSSNGYTWSHSEKTENSVNKGFSFCANDIIEMTFDYQSLRLTFTKYSKFCEVYCKCA